MRDGYEAADVDGEMRSAQLFAARLCSEQPRHSLRAQGYSPLTHDKASIPLDVPSRSSSKTMASQTAPSCVGGTCPLGTPPGEILVVHGQGKIEQEANVHVVKNSFVDPTSDIDWPLSQEHVSMDQTRNALMGSLFLRQPGLPMVSVNMPDDLSSNALASCLGSGLQHGASFYKGPTGKDPYQEHPRANDEIMDLAGARVSVQVRRGQSACWLGLAKLQRLLPCSRIGLPMTVRSFGHP